MEEFKSKGGDATLEVISDRALVAVQGEFEFFLLLSFEVIKLLKPSLLKRSRYVEGFTAIDQG